MKKEPTRVEWRRRWRSLKGYCRREQRAFDQLRDATPAESPLRIEYHRASSELAFVLQEMKNLEEPR